MAKNHQATIVKDDLAPNGEFRECKCGKICNTREGYRRHLLLNLSWEKLDPYMG